MAVTIASAVLGGLGLYLASGLLFALVFLVRGVARIDPDAAHGSLGFRLVILPGLAIFWPIFLVRWLRGDRTPPTECTAHRARGADPHARDGGAR